MIARRSLAPLLALAVPLVVGCQNFGDRRVAKNGGPPVEIPVEQEEKFDDARDTLKDPTRFFLSHARLLEGAGKYDEARKSYATALKEDPRSKDALLGLARMDQLAGRTTEAEERYQRLALAYPDDPLVLDAIGQFYAGEKRWPEALRVLDIAARKAPNDETIQYHLAVASARGGNLDKARALFQRSIGLAESHYNLGYILYEEGRLADAEREFIAAIAAKPDLEEAQVLLGELRGQRRNTNAPVYVDRGPTPDVSPGPTRPSASSGAVVAARPARSIRPTGPTSLTNNRATLARAELDAIRRETVTPTVAETPARRDEFHADDFERPVAPSNEFDAVPAWDPSSDWGPEPQFEAPVRSTSNGLTPAQLEQMRNQQ